MRTLIFRLAAVPVLCALTPAASYEPTRVELPKTSPNVVAPTLRLPLIFVENRGQFAPEVCFQTRLPGLAVNVLTDGWAIHAADGRSFLRLRFDDASPAACAEGLELQDGVANYLIGDADSWVQGAETFGRVRVTGLRPGVDLEFFEQEGRLEYDVLIAPGVDETTIGFTLLGADASWIDADGSLVVIFGEEEIRQRAPRSWQVESDGSRRRLESGFRAVGEHRYGFAVEGRDPGCALVIDPVLVYSEFVGGSNADEALGVAADESGAVYVTGWAKSSDFPMAGGRRRAKEVVVFKLDAQAKLVYATYFGGRNDDTGRAIAVNAMGEVVVVGETRSPDFPTTRDAYDRTRNGNTDAFVMKLAADGATLVYSSYLGAAGDDTANGVALGRDGSAYIVGTTRSRDFPTSSHAIQTRRKGGYDAFVTRLDSKGVVVVYSTYLGGIRDDSGQAIAVDDDGHAYVTGYTDSADFPTTTATLDARKNDVDAFVAKLSAAGGQLVYSTFLGGSSQDQGHGIALDEKRQVYVVGWTQSFDFPVTPDALQGSNRARRDAFLARLSGSGSILTYSTFLGGSGHDEALAVSVDAVGTPWIVGHTSSDDLPVSPDAVQSERAGGKDAFLIGFDPATAAISFATYLGGEGDDMARAVAVQPLTESVVLAGFADDVPPDQRGLYGGTKRGPSDAMIARYEPGECGARAELTVLGSGCGVHLSGTRPRLGRVLELRVTQGPPLTRGYIMVSAPTYSSTVVEEICERHVDSNSTRIFRTFETDEEGSYTFRTRLPKDGSYCGRTLTVQAVTLNADLGPLSFGQMSEGLIITFGD